VLLKLKYSEFENGLSGTSESLSSIKYGKILSKIKAEKVTIKNHFNMRLIVFTKLKSNL